MQLYHHPMSASSRFIRFLMGEYGVEYGLIHQNPWDREAEFMKLNPAGTLPVLVSESDVSICGVYAICEYIDETRGTMMRERRLMPDYPLERAEVRRLIDWFCVRLDQDATKALVRERIFKLEMPRNNGGGAPDSAAMRAARNNVKQHMRYLNWLAGSRNWLSGKTLTAADIAAAASISVLDYMGEITWPDSPQAAEWYQRVKSRPAFRPILEDRIRSLTPVSHYADLDF